MAQLEGGHCSLMVQLEGGNLPNLNQIILLNWLVLNGKLTMAQRLHMASA